MRWRVNKEGKAGLRKWCEEKEHFRVEKLMQSIHVRENVTQITGNEGKCKSTYNFFFILSSTFFLDNNTRREKKARNERVKQIFAVRIWVLAFIC